MKLERESVFFAFGNAIFYREVGWVANKDAT